MTKLRISADLSLPEAAVTSTDIVLGGKGMGKTNFGSVYVEELTKAGMRWSVLDPMGVWWGVRHSKDGKGDGIPCVILGGVHGDIPIEPTGGAVVADLVVDERANVVIDFSRWKTGKMWSQGERIRFVTDYARHLFERQGSTVDGHRREPIKQILDEAARYIPQTIPHGSVDLAKCVGAWEQACEEGRNIGLGVAFLTLRSARIAKSVTELADMMVAFRTIGPNSLAAVMDWLGEHVEKQRIREISSQIRELNVGQALVISPGWLRIEKIVQIRERETFDSSATPKPGQRAQQVIGAGAKPNLAKYEAKMIETIEKAKADDPKELRKKIAELERAARAKPAPVTTRPVVDDRAIERAVAAAVKPYQQAQERARRDVEKSLGMLRSVLNAMEPIAVALGEDAAGAVLAGRASIADVLRTASVSAPAPHALARPLATQPPRAVRTTPAEGVTGVEQRILNTIAGMMSLGVAEPDKATVAALVGYHPNAKSYANAMGSLRTAGRIAYGAVGRVTLTADGHMIAVNSLPVASRAELHRLWFDRLGNVAERILAPILEAYPSPVAAAEVARAADYHPNAKSFANMKGRLRTLGLIDYPGTGLIVATPILFPEGLR